MSKKPLKHLSIRSILGIFPEIFSEIDDYREKKKYLLQDVLMCVLSMFYFKEPSLLAFQKNMQDKYKNNNLATLFNVKNIPSDNQIRNILDKIPSECMEDIYHELFRRLQRGKHLEQYQVLNGYYTISLDGSQYFDSEKINCSHCLFKEKDGKKTYYHQILQAAMVIHGLKVVIPLPPEEIRNEDGTEKQDCERNAAKRMIPKIRKAHPKLKILINVDGLYGNEPFLNCLEENNMSYISVVKSGDHKELFNWIEVNDKEDLNKTYKVKEKKRSRKGFKIRFHEYKWCMSVPLNGKINKNVNYFEYSLINKNGKVTYHSSWITDQPITRKNIVELVRVARTRWKIENECFNTLKNQGYHLEHNFGHGKENLSMVFFTLNMIAFLIHQVQKLTDDAYIKFWNKWPAYSFWETIKGGISLVVFKDWEQLFSVLNQEGKYQLNLTPI